MQPLAQSTIEHPKNTGNTNVKKVPASNGRVYLVFMD